LISPATPAAGMVWLIIDFTVPSAHEGSVPRRAPNTFDSAWTSTTSPTAVPVPWASIRPTVSGATPAAL
jgi:hypothetical protein